MPSYVLLITNQLQSWIYLFDSLWWFPFDMAIQSGNLDRGSIDILWKIDLWLYSHFLTYLLNLLSMKELKPTTVAVFIYLQPVLQRFCYWFWQRRIEHGKFLVILWCLPRYSSKQNQTETTEEQQ
jgi:hypothetical protein